jgi:hypothetical protein
VSTRSILPPGPHGAPARGDEARVPPDPPALADVDGLAVLARAEWPAFAGDRLPPIPGFVISSFSPLVAEVAERCLRKYFGNRPADPRRGERTAVLLASESGDIGTAVAVAQAVDAGRRVPPLLFFQSNPNAVVGHLTARWELAGPVVCISPGGFRGVAPPGQHSPAGGALDDAIQGAVLLIQDGDADAVLVIVAEQGRPGAKPDHGVAMLVGPTSWPPAAGSAEPDDSTSGG